jgi:hypothetical protein
MRSFKKYLTRFKKSEKNFNTEDVKFRNARLIYTVFLLNWLLVSTLINCLAGITEKGAASIEV